MAGGAWWETSPGLRSVFGAIVNAASERASTADVWSAIRDAASNVAARTLSVTVGSEATPEHVSAAAAQLLRGVDATAVSQARSVAGQMVSAHSALISADPNEQITADMVAIPPWATTVNVAGVRTQYRIQVQREIVVHGFTAITRQEWATYDLSGPITNVADALNQANTLFANTRYNRNVDIKQILDYSITAV